MSYKALLTHVVADRGCASRLRVAASVAQAFGAELIGVGARAPWPYASVEDGRGVEFESILGATQDAITEAKGVFKETLKRHAIAKAWRAEVGYPDDVIAKHARAADLVIGYPARRGVDRALYATPDGLLMEAGLPILLIPAAEVEFRAETVLLAWKNTQEARRAISVAMPLLQTAERVLVAAVCRDREVATIEQELADVAARLTRHGVKVATLVEVEAPGAVGRRLLHIAEADKSDLIVAGGYGHSRLREWALGGVTRDLIADGRRFVLLSR
ncbi:MAG: universal stress protein [Caulobacteraceae bacterium]|nr:universal stress protein [Caulobacteraceae bacterium]